VNQRGGERGLHLRHVRRGQSGRLRRRYSHTEKTVAPGCSSIGILQERDTGGAGPVDRRGRPRGIRTMRNFFFDWPEPSLAGWFCPATEGQHGSVERVCGRCSGPRRGSGGAWPGSRFSRSHLQRARTRTVSPSWPRAEPRTGSNKFVSLRLGPGGCPIATVTRNWRPITLRRRQENAWSCPHPAEGSTHRLIPRLISPPILRLTVRGNAISPNLTRADLDRTHRGTRLHYLSGTCSSSNQNAKGHQIGQRMVLGRGTWRSPRPGPSLSRCTARPLRSAEGDRVRITRWADPTGPQAGELAVSRLGGFTRREDSGSTTAGSLGRDYAAPTLFSWLCVHLPRPARGLRWTGC